MLWSIRWIARWNGHGGPKVSKVAKFVGKVAGVVAAVASFIPGGRIVALAATAVSVVATAAAGKPKPRAVGSVANIQIGANQATPFAMGRVYLGGAEIHRTAWGATLKKVPNPYLARTVIYSRGRAQSIEAFQADFTTLALSGTAVTGYYDDFMFIDHQLGATPESDALAAQWAGEPGWSSAHKLSGNVAAKWSLKFDKEGKKFASGEPQIGLIGHFNYVYDPRLDSTYPGGSGACRLNNQATWVYDNNVALRAATYAYGYRENGKLVIGPGWAADEIDWPAVVDWANTCDANDWEFNGLIYEPGDLWANLGEIAETGSARPAFSGGQLTFIHDAPRVALDTITADDLAEGDINIPATSPYATRINTVVPGWRDPASKWEVVQSAKISVAGFVTQDGEERITEVPFQHVTNKDQAAELGAYVLHNSREFEFSLPLKPRMIEYRPGDALTISLPEYAADFVAVMVRRTVDPATRIITAEFRSETATKHALCLGQTGTAPPAAAIITGEFRDGITGALFDPFGYNSTVIRSAGIVPTLGNLSTEADGATAKILIAAHEWDYPNSDTNVMRAAGTITGVAYSTTQYVYFDDATLTNTAPTYAVTTVEADAQNSTAHPDRHYIGVVIVPASGFSGSVAGYDWGGWSGVSFQFAV